MTDPATPPLPVWLLMERLQHAVHASLRADAGVDAALRSCRGSGVPEKWIHSWIQTATREAVSEDPAMAEVVSRAAAGRSTFPTRTER